MEIRLGIHLISWYILKEPDSKITLKHRLHKPTQDSRNKSRVNLYAMEF